MIYKIEIKKNNSLDVTSGAISIKSASNYSRVQIETFVCKQRIYGWQSWRSYGQNGYAFELYSLFL